MAEKDKRKMQRVMKEVTLHGVLDDETSAGIEIHTHGLERYGQTEVMVITNTLFYKAAARLLNEIAYNVIINGEEFKDGENCDYSPEFGIFSLQKAKDAAGGKVLRIVPRQLTCEICGHD
jgi:hypothetical protein